MIHWNLVVYIIVMIILAIGYFKDLFDEDSGDFNLMGGSSGRAGRVGILGIASLLVAIAFTLIWGGFFWW